MKNPLAVLKRIPYFYLIAVPVLLVLSGVASNQAVLVANWGKFPVMMNERQVQLQAKMQEQMDQADQKQANDDPFSSFNTSVDTDKIVLDSQSQFLDDVHSIMGHNSRLKFMADIFNMGQFICSIGDLLLWLGEWLGSYSFIMWLGLILRRLMIL